MRTITLPSGRTVKVGLKHADLTETDHYYELAMKRTSATVELENGVGWTTHAYCSRQDQFVKRLGRLYVARRINRQLTGFFDRADRRVIFNALYAPKPSSKKTASKSEG